LRDQPPRRLWLHVTRIHKSSKIVQVNGDAACQRSIQRPHAP
jgi:hypothetical protein